MTRRLSPLALLEKSVERGQGKKFLGLPAKIPGNRKKRRGGEGSRESPSHSLIMHTSRREGRAEGKALLRSRMVFLVLWLSVL